MYPKKLIETSTHGKSVSHLIKTLSNKPAPPKCTPIGIGTISFNPYDNIVPDVYSFRINDGDTITVRTDTGDGFDIDALAKMNDFMTGKTDDAFVYPAIPLLYKFHLPDDMGMYNYPQYVGGVDGDGCVELYGHRINLENTIIELPNIITRDVTYYRISKAVSKSHKVEILPGEEGLFSFYDALMSNEFYRHQRLQISPWVDGEPMVTLTCGGFELEPFIPTELSDIELGFVEFQTWAKSDADDTYNLLNNTYINIDDKRYLFNDILDADDGVVVNDGVLKLESRDGSYLMSVCCTENRIPVDVRIDNSRLEFVVMDNQPSGGVRQFDEGMSLPSYSNARVTDDSLLEACLTPPAIAPFHASRQTGLYVPYSNHDGLKELWGEVTINGKSYGRKQFIDGFRDDLNTVIDGHTFHFYYGDDGNLVINLGSDYGHGMNTNVYYKIEVKFDSDPMYLKPTNVWYNTRSWNIPFNDRNPTGSLNVPTNTLTVFMKYTEMVQS